MIEIPQVAIGAIAAAIIAGLVSLLGLIVSKEQKVSEFRQAWIDSLRSEISALIAHANAIHGAGAANFGSGPETWKIVRSDFVGINEAAARIRLRLNPKEKDAITVLHHVEALEQLLAPGQAMDYRHINEAEKKLVAAAQILLKKEWLRVRDGERVYRIARFAALSVSAACIFALLAISLVRIADQ